MPLKLEDGKTYLNGDGARVTIGGDTRIYPLWCWSIQGDWYVRATGERLTYGKLAGGWTHYVDARTWPHIVKEAPPDAD